MKILVVCQYYYPEPFRITDICKMLVNRGHDVTVLTGLPNYPEGKIYDDYRRGNKKNEVINGVEIIRTFEIGRGKSHFKLFLNYLSFTISASLKVFFLKEEYDVVFVNQLSPVMMGIPASIYKKKNKKKVLLYCLDLWPESLTVGGVKENSIIYKLFWSISKNIYMSADKILVTSSLFKKYFKEKFNFSIDSIDHLPQYAEDLFLTDELIQTFDSNKCKVYNFVFAGNIGEFQSVETIVYAANELKEYENIYFHIAGDGSKLDECKKIAEKFCLKNLIFYGRKPIEEMPNFYKMADAMLITLIKSNILSYTLPGKIQTYMAAGKPIIGAIDGETRKVLDEANCGFCCEAENHMELSKLILKFIQSDRKEEMSLNAKNFYLKNYSKTVFLEKLENELLKLGAK